MKSGKISFKSRFESLLSAFSGLLSLIKNEVNSRIHLLAALLIIITGIILRLSFPEWCFISLAIGLVFITELINSSLESICDRIQPEWNELIRKAKDYSAAAVLVAAIIAVIIGCFILLPKLLSGL